MLHWFTAIWLDVQFLTKQSAKNLTKSVHKFTLKIILVGNGQV